ncbi:MAG: aspartate carbamoyltransferase regulatory subunit [Candidatus Baldrarchaeia archaeon]
MNESELRVQKIKDGTVIDHITQGNALNVLRILGITGKEGNIVSIVMNVPSRKLGKKDIVKIEGRELNPREVNMIALIAPKATINIIRDYQVIEKRKVKLPKVIKGIVKCINPMCVSNNPREPIEPVFVVIDEHPIKLRCQYCGMVMTHEDIEKQF